MLKATIPVVSLKSVLGVISTVNNETVMRIAPAGISITTVDPANTAMICIELRTIAFVNYDATEYETVMRIPTVDSANTAMTRIDLGAIAFANYDATECEIGIDVEAFKKIIDVADDSDLITLETSMDMKELVVEFGPFLYVMALLTNVRNPGHPSFSRPWTTSVCIPGHRFKQMVKAVEVVNDYASIGVEDNGEFFMDAVDGDHVKQVSAVLRNMCTKTPQKKTQSLYSLDYLQGLAEAVPADGTAVLHIGDDVPMLTEFMCCDGGKVRYVLAPRIESD